MVEAPAQLVLVLAAVAPGREVSQRLAGESYAVVEVRTAAEALDAVGRLHFDVIVLDAELPGTPGIELCRRLRADTRLSRTVPILILTDAKPTPDQRVSALQAGVWDFISAASFEDVSLRVQTYLQAKRNIDDAIAGSLVDPFTGLHTLPGLARRARELGALLAREHRGSMACVVFALDDQHRRAAGVVNRCARISDVVGLVKPGECAILAPATDHQGAIRLAWRLDAELRKDLGIAAGARAEPAFRAGYDAVASIRYAPIDPAVLLSRAAAAVQSGSPEPQLPWLRRYVPDPSDQSTPAVVAG